MQKLRIAFLLCLTSLATAQIHEFLADAGIATCEYSAEVGRPGKWVTSPTGESAAVELRVRVAGTGKQRTCTTSWVLHIRGSQMQPHTIVVAKREDSPEDNEWIQENSFELNAGQQTARWF